MDYLIIRISDSAVVAARFALSGRGVALKGAAEMVLDGEMNLSAAAARIASGITDSPRVVLCLPSPLFAHRALDLPLADLRKVREILPAHLQGDIALPAEEAVFDALPMAAGRFLAFWARRTDISKAIDVFKEAGCEPQIVGSDVFAWPYLPDLPAECAVSDSTALAVVSGGCLVYVRPFEGIDRLKQLSATLSALELSGEGLPGQLAVFGAYSDALIAEKGLPLEPHPLELPDQLAPVFRTEAAYQQLAGLYAVARACQAGNFPDFRRGSLAWTAGDKKLRRQLLTTALLTVAVVVLLFVYKGMQYRSAKSDLASLNNSIASQYREIFPSRSKAVDELAEVKGELRKLAGSEGSGNVLDILKKMAETKGTTINGLYEAELEGRTVRIKGDARSAQSVNEFKSSMGGLLASMELGEIKSRPDGTVSFSLTGQLKEVGK